MQPRSPVREFGIEQVDERVREGCLGKDPPSCLLANGKLRLNLEEKPVTGVVRWGLAVEIRAILKKSRHRAESLNGPACLYNE